MKINIRRGKPYYLMFYCNKELKFCLRLCLFSEHLAIRSINVDLTKWCFRGWLDGRKIFVDNSLFGYFLDIFNQNFIQGWWVMVTYSISVIKEELRISSLSGMCSVDNGTSKILMSIIWRHVNPFINRQNVKYAVQIFFCSFDLKWQNSSVFQ